MENINSTSTSADAEYHPVIYSIDSDNLIVEVNTGWDHFLLQNNDADSTAVVGRSILDFISGKVTKQFWIKQFNLVRERGTASIEYRCDAPDLKRWMRMNLRLLDDNRVQITNELLAYEKRTRPIHFLPASQRGRQTAIRCSLCNKLKSTESWFEPDELHDQTGTFHVTYGICPD